MDEMMLAEKLMAFGLTRQEAFIYLCLCRNGSLTGYEAAKQTGISRSNVYNALGGLTEKGAAYLMEGASSHYVALPVDQFCDNKIRRLEELREWLCVNVPEVDEPSDGYITIIGEQQILDKMHYMMEQAEKRVYISVSGMYLQRLEHDIQSMTARKIKVVLLTDYVPDFIRGTVNYHTEGKENQIRLISDARYVLTGELNGTARDTCLYSGQRVFVDALKEAMRNEIKLIEISAKNKDSKKERR